MKSFPFSNSSLELKYYILSEKDNATSTYMFGLLLEYVSCGLHHQHTEHKAWPQQPAVPSSSGSHWTPRWSFRVCLSHLFRAHCCAQSNPSVEQQIISQQPCEANVPSQNKVSSRTTGHIKFDSICGAFWPEDFYSTVSTFPLNCTGKTTLCPSTEDLKIWCTVKANLVCFLSFKYHSNVKNKTKHK